MNKFLTLVKREYWENKGAFFKLPSVVGLIFSVFFICLTLLSLVKGHVWFFGGQNIDVSQIGVFVDRALYAYSFPFVLMLWIVVFNYFLSAFYQERKDGSILFWQSLPISQFETVLSKWVAGLLIAPLCAWLVIIATELIILCLGTIVVWHSGHFSPLLLWSPSMLMTTWLSMLSDLYMQVIWLFPILAWCLFCSSFAKKSPFLRAFIIPVILIIIEAFLKPIFHQGNIVGHFIGIRVGEALGAWGASWQSLYANLAAHSGTVSHGLASLESSSTVLMLVGLVVGVIFSILAGVLRSKCYGYEK